MLQKVATIYLDHSPTLLSALQQAVAQGDTSTIQQAAHSLKSSSGNIGALTLADLCKDLEMMGRTGYTTDAAATLSLLLGE